MKTLIWLTSLIVVASWLHSPTALAANELTRAYGGSGGATFLDQPPGRIAGVRIRAGRYVDSVQFAYRKDNKTTWGPQHGGNGGKLYEIKFESGERITEIGGRYGKYLDSVYIKTNRKTYPTRGGDGGSRSFKIQGRIKGFWGRSGSLVDALGAVRTFSNSQPNSSGTRPVTGYKPSSGSDEKGDSVTPITFPQKNTSAGGLSDWLKNHNRRLYRTVENLAGSYDAMNQYRRGENNYCNGNVYCEIAYREDAIAYATGSQ